MQYSNLKDEEQEERPRVSKKINISTDDLLKKKESYWFLALILSLIRLVLLASFLCLPMALNLSVNVVSN